MKTFNSLDHFVEHYKNKLTIPSTADIIINDKLHSFNRISHHNKITIGFNQWDCYTFEEGFMDSIDLYLKVNFYRYFEEKTIFEAFFEFNHKHHSQMIKWICPIYFYDQFVYGEKHKFEGVCINKTLKNWTGLDWIDVTRFKSDSLSDLRLDAFNKMKNDLFYANSIRDLEAIEVKAYQNKWKIDDKGNSPFFNEIEYAPTSWHDEEDDDDE